MDGFPVGCLKNGSVTMARGYTYNGLAWCICGALCKGIDDKCECSNSRGISLLNV